MGNKTEFETRNGVNGKLDERRNIIFQRKTRKTGKKQEKQGEKNKKNRKKKQKITRNTETRFRRDFGKC